MSRSRPLSTKHSSTKRKQSAYHNDDFKDQTLPKNKRAKLTSDLYMMSLFFVDREARSCTENNGGLPISGMYSEVSQIGRMVSEHNNDADDDSYVDTETTEDTNGISDYDDDADDDYDINDDNDNGDDDNDETAEQPIGNSDDNDGSDTNGDEAGDEQAGDEQAEDEQAEDEQVEDEQAAVLQELADLRERLDRLDAHINTAMTNIHALDYRVEIVLTQIDITHERMAYLRERILNVEFTSREINNRVALLPTRANINEVTANANMHQVNNTRRMDGFDLRFDQVMELLRARLPERNVENVAADGNNRDNLQPPITNNLPALNGNNQLDADANQLQADINQQPQAGDPQQEQVPVANDDQQEQDPPLNGPPGNGGEGVNNNVRNIAIQQFIYVRNMEFY